MKNTSNNLIDLRSKVVRRYRQDFRFAMMILFGSLLLAVILGFVIFRLSIGHYYGAFVNFCVVLSLAFVLAYAVQTEDTNRAGIFFILVNMTACIASTAMFGHTGLFWAYLVLWVNFLMARRRIAFTANLFLIFGLFFNQSLYNSNIEAVTFLVTSLLLTIFSIVFVDRLQRQQEQLEQLAMQDPLTKTGNRRMMQQELEIALAQFRRDQQPATIVLMDLDHFKQVNDQKGHEAGDEMLRQFAQLVRKNSRKGDGFFRYGGEEFVLLLPGHDQDAALAVAKLMHQRVSGKIQMEDWPLHYSAGVAGMLPEESWPQWLVRSDQALYQAKQRGRDQVVAWDDGMTAMRGELTLDPELI